MKKILFLILFLTGITPVFKNNTLNLVSNQAYGQDPSGGLEVLIFCNGTKVTTEEINMYTTKITTCEKVNEGGIYTNDCVWDCYDDYEYTDPPEPDPCNDPNNTDPICNPNCTTVCSPDMILNNNCECEYPPCTITCPEGQRVTPDCGCEEIPPPSNCRIICPTGYTEVNCSCVKINTPPPTDPVLPDPCAKAKTNDLRSSNSIISAQTNTIRANSQPGGNEFGAEQNLTSFPVTNNSPTYMNVPVRDGGYPDAFIPAFTWNANDGYTIGVNHGHLEGTGPSSPDIFKAYEYLSNPELKAAGQDAIDYFKANFTITTTLQDATYTVNIKDWNAFGTLRNKYYADTITGNDEFGEYALSYKNKNPYASIADQYIYAALTLYGNAITITKLEKDATKSIPIKLDGINIISSPCPQ